MSTNLQNNFKDLPRIETLIFPNLEQSADLKLSAEIHDTSIVTSQDIEESTLD